MNDINRYLFSNVFISISQLPHDLETQCKEPCSQEVPQSSQERNGYVVRVKPPVPNLVDKPVSNSKEYGNLHGGENNPLDVCDQAMLPLAKLIGTSSLIHSPLDKLTWRIEQMRYPVKNMTERVVWPAFNTWMTVRNTAEPGRTKSTSNLAVVECLSV